MRDSLGARLRRLAGRIDRLKPLNHCPEAFFIERDEIRAALEREADSLDGSKSAPNERGRFQAGALVVKGRVIRAERRESRARAPRSATI